MKLGIKETLSLLAAGYKKKDIDAMLAEEDLKQEEPTTPPAENNSQAQDNATAENSNPEPDYKKLYEDLLKEKDAKEKEIQDKDQQILEIQKDNIHEDNLPELEKSYEEEHDSLVDALRSFY